MPITSEGEKLLKKLCTVYRTRRKAKETIDQAGSFASAEAIRNDYFPDWTKEDVIRACENLKDNDYLKYIPLDNQPQEIQFTDKAVAHSQQTILRFVPKLFGWLWRVIELVLSGR